MGEKEPLEDKRETHGLCSWCFDETLEEAERYLVLSRKQAISLNDGQETVDGLVDGSRVAD